MEISGEDYTLSEQRIAFLYELGPALCLHRWMAPTQSEKLG